MKVLFRTDASIHIGSGHVMRCLTLAQALSSQGITCHFLCRDLTGNLHQLVRAHGFHLIALDTAIANETDDAKCSLLALEHDYHLLVIDHYQLGANYCRTLRQRCTRIMVIDDLANRPHDCNLLLDQNLLPDAASRYVNLVPNGCSLLLGPQYALLRNEFYHVSSQMEHNHILIGFGGSDEQNLTGLALNALEQLKLEQLTADIVIGANNPWRASLEQQIARLPNAQLHVQCNYMATLMFRARLMLGAGGASHWERCICGLPGLIVTVAENQQATTAYLDELGACVWLGRAAEMSAEFFAEQLCYYLSQPALLDEMGQTASALVPADSGTKLVVRRILAMLRGQQEEVWQ